MALSERIKNPPTKPNGRPCSIGALIAQLEGDELAALNAMLGTPEKRGWPESDIFDALTAEGYVVGRQTVNRHRGGRCGCSKATA
jgi:hypothetical protein